MKTLPQLALAIALLAPLAVRAQTNGLDVNIRSGIDRDEYARREKDPAYAQDASKRKRLYFLAHIQEEKNGFTLAHPVDARALAKQLDQALQAQGFHPIKPGQIPDIIVTMKYGQGVPPNPFTGFKEPGRPDLSDSGTNGFVVDHKTYVGLEEKSQRVSARGLLDRGKLIMEVRAWEYPPPKDPTQKEKLLWLTTMYVDDPDHRDLNAIAEKMLAQAAPYFDHHLDRESDLHIRTDQPDGHVKVGTLEVVPTPKTN
jgi:hypothetical protein